MNFPLDFNAIAPFWADADARVGSGTIKFGRSNDMMLLGRIERDISAAFPEFSWFSPTYAYIFTWNDIGRFNQNTDLVSPIAYIAPMA